MAEYPDNRYVLTSRIRGYTGGAILRGKFRRCDIQDFDDEDIKRFSRNWLCALLNVSPAEVENPGTQANREHQELIRAVADPRVRQLAVNPLLMTVIAVVHWNRKRLPEQRVELYDECIDVLLGQRKDAETIHLVARWQQIYDRVKDRERRYEMRWTRKRFAEIGLAVLRQEKEEEITKDRVVAVLMKPFTDRCQGDEEEARFEAELFLDHQELRSGLLVSRRSHSYRFVHLTFQEYLAAWGLAGRSDYWPVVQEYLLDQKWFETLQLLGGVFAAEHSDDKLCEYLDLLLDEMGEEIASRAHVVALCANIVRDAEGVADLRLETRQAYEEALQGTMGVFEPDARVADKTQLEVLEALGRLGRVAKDQLIAATRSQHRAVRSKALDYLCPHLPDQDLFAMAHIFADKSKEPIKTYIQAMLERDEGRAAGLLAAVEEPSTRFAEALADLKLVHLLPSFTAVISCFLAAENRDSAQYYLTEMIRRDETGTSKALSGVRDWSWAATAAITNLGREDLLSDDALFSIVEAAEPWYYSGPHFYELAFERDAGRLAGLTRTRPYIVGYLVESGRPDLVDDETFFVVFEVILFRLSPLREADWMPEHIDSYFLPGRGMGTSGAWVAEAFRRDRDRAMAIVADCGRRGHLVWDMPLIQMMTSESNVCRPDWVEWALKTGDLSLLDRFSDESIVDSLLSLPEWALSWPEPFYYYRDPTVRQRFARIAQRVLELDPGRQDVREWLEWVT